MSNPLDRLTDPQLECLRLVAQHKNSKQIAIDLNLSSHAIDARLKRTLLALGVATRQEAARLYLAHTETYQPLVYASPDAAQESPVGDEGEPTASQPLDAGPPGFLHQPAHTMAAGAEWSVALPIRTAARPQNDLPWTARLAWMLVILIGTVVAVTLLISTAEGLSRLL